MGQFGRTGICFQLNDNYNTGQAISMDQTAKIVNQYVRRLNPEFRVGEFNNAGHFYETEIMSASDEEVFHAIGVYKLTGRLMVLNQK
ncbi:hypothetical protein KKA14_13810 [bacterium]|nr:hypothetical protein [bacterium]